MIGNYKEIELNRIKPSPMNPRKGFDGPKFDELTESIRKKGVLQPIIVRQDNVDYEIVVGERRWRAACKVAEENGGIDTARIPAVVRQLTDDEAFEVMMVENLQRADLTEREEADSFKAYLDRKGEEALPDLSERTGIDARYIRRRVRILTLPPPVLEAWEKGKLVYGHLEQLRRLEDEKDILALFKEITEVRGWDYESEGKMRARPVAWLRQTINERSRSIELKYALFDRAECKACSKNSNVQEALFGQVDLKAACLDPKCFKQKQNNWLMVPENWKKTKWAKKDKTIGFRFHEGLDYNSYERIWNGPRDKKCAQCDKFCSIIALVPDRYGSEGAACFDPACYRKKFQIERSSGKMKNKAEARSSNHGELFRESFYAQRLPLVAAAIPPDDTKTLRLALVAMIHKNHDLLEWFSKRHKGKKGKQVGYWYQSAPEIWAVVKDLSREDVLKDLQEAALQISLAADYGAKGRHMIAEHFGVDLGKEWLITERYLEVKTKAEILALDKKLNLLSDKKAQAYLYEKMGKKRGCSLEGLKKCEMVQAIMKSGVDLVGKVPDEILTVK